jgi:diguanylate cyclase (GGDEF)-like protein
MTTDVTPPRILVVEDDRDERELICEALAMHYGRHSTGRIVGVATGAECLASDIASFDVVLLDYHLPDMNGLTTLERILEAADVPVVFVTGENDSAIAAEAIRKGALDYVVKHGDFPFALPVVIEKTISQHDVRKENERLQAELHAMLAELQHKNVQLEQMLEQMQELAATDHLTGLGNRRQFAEVLERAFSEAVRYGPDLSCCMCDLDHYKTLNDMLGHQVGDEILMLAADVIRQSLRRSDAAARYGGDEFVLLLPHTSLEAALAVGRRVRADLVARAHEVKGLSHGVTMSVGVASLAGNRPTTADALVSMADRALFAAKAAGKDRIVVFGADAAEMLAASAATDT